MATPRTLRLPLSVDSYGGTPLTAIAEQGKEATEQLLFLELTPPGQCSNPWGQMIGLREDVIFEEPGRVMTDLRSLITAKFEILTRKERARLLPDTLRMQAESGNSGRYVLSFQWQDLRRNALRETTLRLGGTT